MMRQYVGPVLLLLMVRLVGQDAPYDIGESVELSPFEVSSEVDHGYIAGAQAALRPQVAITLIKPADAILMEFALSNSAAKQEVRNRELSGSIEALGAAIARLPGVRLEHREVRLATGNRRLTSILRSNTTTSFANLVIFAELDDATRLYERTKQVRAALDGARLQGDTKLMDGPVGLFIAQPAQYRDELLNRIFEDVDGLKRRLGGEFEVLVSGLTGPVRVRPCSEREVELWLDYGFQIRSIRELTQPKAAR